MDLADVARTTGTLPSNNSIAVATSILIIVEGSRTMYSLVGDDRFSHPHGGEIMGSTYVAALGILGSVLTKSTLPALAAAGSIAFCIATYYWQEEKAHEY